MQRSNLRSFDVILTASQRSIGTIELDGEPSPGSLVSWSGETYAVLECRHRYRYTQGRYQLAQALLYVQPSGAAEARLIDGQWILGDPSCRFNSHLPLIRCAVNPQGPCLGCAHYEADAS